MATRARSLLAILLGVTSSAALATAASCGDRTGLALEDATASDAGSEAAEDVADAIPPIDAQPDVPVVNPCPDAAATLIYVMGQSRALYSFDPSTLAFAKIGVIDCPGSVGSPFSMAVDREGAAYVVYTRNATSPSGNPEIFTTGLYRVSTKSAACSGTAYDPNRNGQLPFGMGFVANSADAGDGGETLFVSEDHNDNSDDTLASIDTTTLRLSEIGRFTPTVKQAELTGTGAGRLFAFQPLVMGTSSSFIYEIDPTSAKVTAADSLDNLPGGSGWAFGFWGGKFYLFTAPSAGPHGPSVVHQFDPDTKALTMYATGPANDLIVGAGVSTCAPLGP